MGKILALCMLGMISLIFKVLSPIQSECFHEEPVRRFGTRIVGISRDEFSYYAIYAESIDALTC